jgi:hypothetical protein
MSTPRDSRQMMDAVVVVEREGKLHDVFVGRAFDAGNGVWKVRLDAVPPSGAFELRETEETRKRKAVPFQTSADDARAYSRFLRRMESRRGDGFAVVGDVLDEWDYLLQGLEPSKVAPEPSKVAPEPASGPWVGPQRPWPEQIAERSQARRAKKKHQGARR